jgi:23S rRNA (uracil1939-C5)-methyltransferase
MEGLKFSMPNHFTKPTLIKRTNYKITRDFAGLTEKKSCMIYTQERELLLSLFQKSKKSGVESVPDAIKDAKANAVRKHKLCCEFFVGDMKVVFNDDFIAQHGQPDVILPIHLGRNAGCN